MSLWVGTLGSQITFVPVNFSLDYLVIAGGGAGTDSGGFQIAGHGGGAGGYRSASFSAVTGTEYIVTVGAGAAVYESGSDSIFSNITSIGGGRGGLSGGSGGGGGGTGTSGQGNNGGNTNFAFGASPGGGGGGAGSVGGTALSSGQGGAGGSGLASSITGTSVIRGGGGGGMDAFGSSQNGGVAGSGGGGNGSNNSYTVFATNGQANTGGGGGGGYTSSWNGTLGGSGIIILKIPNTRTATFTGGVVSSLNTAVSGFKIYTITAAGASDKVTFT